MNLLKNDFGYVVETMFHDVQGPCEITFSILGIEKSNFYEVT
jgi:hypothetical protein